MKNRFAPLSAALCLLFASLSGIAHGQTLQFWNVSGTGGDGIWGTGLGDKNWNLVPGAPAGNTAWQDGIDDVAVFQDAAGGIVTLFDTVQTHGITQQGADYRIDAGTIVMTKNTGGNTPFVNVGSGVLAVDAQLSGTDGLLKTGAGTLLLSSANSFTGPTVIAGGTLDLTGSLPNVIHDNLSISSGATLLNRNGGLSDSVQITNAGSLALDMDDTVNNYFSNGGTLANGAGTLFTSSASINNGSIIAGKIETNVFVSNGNNLISGTVASARFGISNGTLTLTGEILNKLPVGPTLTIDSGGTLLNQSGGLSSTTILSNSGTLTLNADDTIDRYGSSGGGTLTAGAGTLFTTTAGLGSESTVAGLLNTGTLTTSGALISGTVTAGSASIQNNTLTLSGSLISDTVNIASSASLLNQNGGLSSSATLTNAGSLTLNANDSIASYVSNGGTLTAGAGTLFTTSAALNDGTTVAGLLHAGTLTSNGAVAISGTATAATTSIQSGTLTLSGSLASVTVGIAAGASLLNQNDGLSTTATITNAGSLTLNASDTIASYISNGGTLTAGAGTLFTSGTTLNNGSTVAGLLNTGTLTSNGAVLLSGTATVRSSLIESGTLTLSGSLLSNTLGIASGASLLNQNGGLSNNTFLANVGSLTLDLDDTIRHYMSNGGTLTAGAGTLFTTNADLNNGSTVAGLLNTSTLTSFGAVLLSGTATAGIASIQSGTLTLSGSLVSDNVRISSGATLLNQNGGLSTTATLTNAGSLTLNASDTITSYISNGGTLTAGAGTLFTTSAALNNNSTVAGLLNAGTLTSNGAVAISGTATAGSASFSNGTLTLSGSLVSDTVNIASNASLLNQNSGLSSTATLTNAGSLTLNASDTITSYISNGGTLTAGAGTLFTTSAALNDGSTVAGVLHTGTLTSNGAVLLSGTATVTDTATVQSGTLNLTGTLTTPSLNILSGATMIQDGTMGPGSPSLATTVVTNEGSFIIRKTAVLNTYISNGGLLDIQNQRMITQNVFLNDGSTTMGGSFSADLLVTNGNVTISGSALGELARIASGSLLLQGTLSSRNVEILNGATLLNQSGGLSSSAVLTNVGSLTLDVDDTIASYISNGGTLTTGAGTLSTTSATLNDGSTVAGLLNTGTLTSNGAVLLSGTATAGSASIQSGTFGLGGSLVSDTISIANGASLINQAGGLSNTATLTNAGSLTLNANDTIASYISNGGALANGPGTLFTTNAALNDGSTVAGRSSLNTGTLTSNGAVLLSGTATAGSASIQSGTLTLSGSLVSDTVGIASGASLLNQNGGLSSTATLTNAGSLTLDASDTIASYISNGGTLTTGTGTLFTTSTTLNDGSTIAGLLDSNTLTSDGSVQVTGTVAASNISIDTGTLTNTGTFGIPSALLNLNEGATLVANGLQQYALLTTSGSGPGNWLGDLLNTSTVAPGGVGETGILAVDGNFSQSPTGTLRFDLSAAGSDLLDVSGSATFGGALDLNQSGAAIAPFVPVTVVSAAAYSGKITSLSENLDGVVFFNPGNGTVTRLELPSGGGDSFFGATRNQTSTWISLYDDVIDPSITNITTGPSGYEITSGIADVGNPDLLWALSASFTPDGLNAALLNRLSPEVYGGFSDYAIQATRAHQRSALSAPALAPRAADSGSKSGIVSSAKGGTKGGIADHAVPLDWEFFAALDHFRAGTDNSHNQADYDFDGTGVLAGARTWLRDRTQLAVYLGADWGSVEGDLIDADAFGWTLGLIGGHLLDEKSRTRLTAGMSYGVYQFDGTRTSAAATAAGWSPGKVRFDDVDVDAFDLFVAVDGVAWQKDELTLIPSVGLRYTMSKMDSFSESTGGAPGSPIALEVGRDRHEALLLELGLMARVEVNASLALWGEGGVNIDLLDNDRVLAARFARGSRMMRAEADGLDGDSIYLGCGAIYRISESISAALGYRADIRSGADAQHEMRLSSSWRF